MRRANGGRTGDKRRATGQASKKRDFLTGTRAVVYGIVAIALFLVVIKRKKKRKEGKEGKERPWAISGRRTIYSILRTDHYGFVTGRQYGTEQKYGGGGNDGGRTLRAGT